MADHDDRDELPPASRLYDAFRPERLRHVTHEELRDLLREHRVEHKADMQEFKGHVSDRLDAILDHLRQLNGKTATHGELIAVLRDRSDTVTQRAQQSGRNYGAMAGGGIAAAIWAVIELLPKLIGRQP